jgi:hypothetical protein
VRAPAAAVPLEQDDLGIGELAADRSQSLGAFIDPSRVRLDDRQALPGHGLVGDELAVAADPALRPPEVEEPDAPERGRRGQSVYPSRRSSTPASASISATSDG